MADARPVQKCACGADCDWCVGANRARAAFPRAKVPPRHDGDTEHECMACFLKRDDLTVVTCGDAATGESPARGGEGGERG